MKTLEQIEPRTPISTVPYVITEPGSYYLTTNLAVSLRDAISIATNGVTLDLNGFTISSTASSGTGSGILLLNGPRNVTILNGYIQGSVTNDGSGNFSGNGFGYGIYYMGVEPDNVRVRGVSVFGCRYHGIYLLSSAASVVNSCTVRSVGSYGITAATVKDSVAQDCGNVGIDAVQVADSEGLSSGGAAGISAVSALNCYGYSNGDGSGVAAETAENCSGASFSGSGVSAKTAQNCSGSSISGNGISANSAHNCHGLSSSGSGISAMAVEDAFGTSSGGEPAIAAGTAQACYANHTGLEVGDGLDADSAFNCEGFSTNGYAIWADRLAVGCHGYSGSSIGVLTTVANACEGISNGDGDGVNAVTANNCIGTSAGGGNGVFAGTANNCQGDSQDGYGVRATVAIGCQGSSTTGTGLKAGLANSCSATSYDDGSEYNMP